MIEFVTKQEVFRQKKEQLLERLVQGVVFPENVFSSTFKYIVAFDFDFRSSSLFYNGLIDFLRYIQQENFTFYTLSPSPDTYYFKHFGIYGISSISTNNSYQEYLNFLNKDLSLDKGYIGEFMEMTSNEISYFSDNPNWCIYGSREWEVSIVAFENKDIMNLFLDSFGQNRDIFSSLSERIEDLDNTFHFSENAKKEYASLLRNYSVFKCTE